MITIMHIEKVFSFLGGSSRRIQLGPSTQNPAWRLWKAKPSWDALRRIQPRREISAPIRCVRKRARKLFAGGEKFPLGRCSSVFQVSFQVWAKRVGAGVEFGGEGWNLCVLTENS